MALSLGSNSIGLIKVVTLSMLTGRLIPALLPFFIEMENTPKVYRLARGPLAVMRLAVQYGWVPTF